MIDHYIFKVQATRVACDVSPGFHIVDGHASTWIVNDFEQSFIDRATLYAAVHILVAFD